MKGEERLPRMKLALYWVMVGIPLSWGVWRVVSQSLVLFGLSA